MVDGDVTSLTVAINCRVAVAYNYRNKNSPEYGIRCDSLLPSTLLKFIAVVSRVSSTLRLMMATLSDERVLQRP